MKKLSVILTLILIIFVGYYVYNEYLKKVETNPYENTLRDYSNQVLETIKKGNIPHKHDVVAMIWTNEEGSLYPPAIMVSGMCAEQL